jgi:hypothetical protein
MVMSRSGSYGERNFTSWLGIALISTLGLVVLGAVLDVARRRQVAPPYPASGGPAAGAWTAAPVASGPRPIRPRVDSAQQRAYVMGGLKLIAVGVGVLVLGAVLTYVLSSLFSGSGTAILATGAFAVGLISIVRGLYYVFIRGFIQ